MLPESRDYFKRGGFNNRQAGLCMMGCFIAGFLGIQAISRFLHRFMPSHVVDCDHTHDDNATDDGQDCDDTRPSRPRHTTSHVPIIKDPTISQNDHADSDETTPLIGAERIGRSQLPKRHASARGDEMVRRPRAPLLASHARATIGGSDLRTGLMRKQSMAAVQQRVMSFVRDTKTNCDELGSCYGYTDPCGQECFKHLSSRSPIRSRQQTVARATPGPFSTQPGPNFHSGSSATLMEAQEPVSPKFMTSRAASRDGIALSEENANDHDGTPYTSDDEDVEAQHHHHVPTNAFLSIGLQTSIAIALHKFPEGFITYATNHANPSLGFNVFLALFVHNITEGFAMALPLYMALNSRWKAMAWSAVLGGLSQPMGAAIAVLWFELSKKTHLTPDAVAYACLFAITAGIMVSVALQLFVESLSLNHNRNLGIFFGFLGMALLGVSNAVFSEH